MLHGGVPSGPGDVWQHWSLQPGVLVCIAAAGAVYAFGVRRLWRRSGTGRVLSRARVAACATGLLVLAAALVSPLDPLADVLFAAHMTQHLLLILVAAPLLLLGAPEVALLWALPPRWRGAAGHAWQRLERSAGDGMEGGARLSLAAVIVAASVLWLWHMPRLYDLAVSRERVHALEHVMFLATSCVFWASVLRLQPRAQLGNGPRVLYVFAMALQGSVLGALITFASRPLYRSHEVIAPAWGLTPLADQQLAGLIMWVPPALLYIGVTAYLFVRWLAAIGARSREQDARRSAALETLRAPGHG